MTSEEQTTGPSTAPPDRPEVTRAGTPGERARALLRLRPYRRLWTAQLVSGTADRLSLLVLVPLTVVAAVVGGQFGDGYRSLALAVAAVFTARMLATVLFGAALLGPVHALVGEKLDRRWVLVGADVLRAVLVGVAAWWSVWTPGAATWVLLGTVFAAAPPSGSGRSPRPPPSPACCRPPTRTPRPTGASPPPPPWTPSAPWTTGRAGPPCRSARPPWSPSPCSTTSSPHSARTGCGTTR
ncbi:hypothetical protein ACFQ1I_21640 [Kitasatospora arboriphila]